MRIVPWQDAILERMRAQLNNDIPVKDGGYGEGSDESVARLKNGLLQPYVLVWFGGTVSAPAGNNSAAGVRMSTRLGLVHMECVASDSTMARKLGDEVRDALVGFAPANEGELEEDGQPTIRNPISTTTGVDVRYAYPLTFQGLVNAAGT